MKIINQSYEVLNRESSSPEDVYKYIESIGRTCYKSEENITPTSAAKFVNMLNARHHWAMLEHFIFRIKAPRCVAGSIRALGEYNDTNLTEVVKYFRFIFIYDTDEFAADAIIIASPTAINNLSEALKNSQFIGKPGKLGFNASAIRVIAFINELHAQYPLIINEFTETYDYFENSYFDLERYDARLISTNHKVNIIDDKKFYEIVNKTEADPKIDPFVYEAINLLRLGSWFSVRFIINRGVSHELVRHRPASYAQESTRYVDYSKDKYNSEITVIKPYYLEDDSQEYKAWHDICIDSEKAYFKLRNMGVAAQWARGVLPTDVKTEIVCTATLNEWLHIFNMRCDAPAHPQIREVMIPLFIEISKYYRNNFFNDNELLKNELNKLFDPITQKILSQKISWRNNNG